jgi:hypothetical protein
MKICRQLSVFLGGIPVLASVALLAYRSQAQPSKSASVLATYARGRVRVLIPYDAMRAGDGNLTVEVLDPEDRIVGRIDRRVYASKGQGSWTQAVQLNKTLAVEDLVWHRLHYQFTYKDEEADALRCTYSISRILYRPVVHVLGQQSYLSGAFAAVRLIVTDQDNETTAGSGAIQIELVRSEQPDQTLYVGRLNQRGTTDARFRFPAVPAGGVRATLHRGYSDRIGRVYAKYSTGQ